MGALANVRERVPFIKLLVDAQKTGWYPAFLAILCFISGTNDYKVYIPIMWLLLTFHLFSVLFADDKKVFLTSLLMLYFALGQDYDPSSFYQSNGDMLANMDKRALPHLIVICMFGVGSLLLRLVFDGSLWKALKRRKSFTWGIIAMDAAFLLNGVLGADQRTDNFAVGALLAMGFTVVYLLVSAIIEDSEDPVTYACQVTLAVAYNALMQISVSAARLIELDALIIDPSNNNIINRMYLNLGWGVCTVVGGIFVLGIPAAMYLAKNRRASWFYFFSCPLFIIGTIVINARTSMAVAIVAFALCSVVACIWGKNCKYIRWYSAIMVLAVILLIVCLVNCSSDTIDQLMQLLRLKDSDDPIRQGLWENGIDDFISSPIFGIGFNNGGYPEGLGTENFYSNMYHCILIQIPAAMGIFGCVAFLIHIYEMATLFFKRLSIDKMFMLMIPLMILGMSLLDNFFFYLHFQLFYGAFMAISEKLLTQNKTIKEEM